MTDTAANIVVVDDEARMCESLQKLLSAEGYAVKAFVDSAQAMAALQAPNGFDCVITDIKMPGPDGMQILRQAQESDPLAPVILMTGYASLESAVEAVNAGAYDYLLKPIEFPELKHTVERGLAKRRSDQNRRELLERLARQNRMLRERLKELRTLHRVGLSISSSRPLEAVLQDLLVGATQVTNAEQGSLMLLDSESSELSIHAAIGLPDEIVRNTRLKVGEGISGYVAQTREVVRVENVAADPRFARTPHPRYESKSFLSVPLLVSDRILGVLNVSSKTGGEPFRPRDLRVLTIFAAQAAAFIDDARNFENNRRQLQEQRVLFNIAREVATAERFEDVASAIYSSLKEVLPLDFGLWLGWNEVRNVLHHRSTAGEKIHVEQWADFELPLPQDTWQNEARFCELVRLAVKGHSAWPSGLRVLQVMAIHGEERPRGALVLGSYRVEKLTPQQLQIAMIAGSQAASVYERQQGALNTTRMATMGNMISEIAHDLKKPLTNIKGSLQLLEQKHPELAEADPFFQSADQEIHHLNDLVRELVEFSNPVRYPLDRVALRVPVERALGLIRSEATRRNISVDESYAPHPINVRGQENEIVKALLNVVHNAVDSMNDGGALSVKTFVAQPENERENYAAVEIRDTGHGIKPEEQHKIFARHFTTKETGSGLGLSIVERILQAHNGLIAVKSEPGVGSSFILYFPLAS